MLIASIFFGVVSVIAIVATIVEYNWAKRKGLAWYNLRDTLGNYNLAIGQLFLSGLSSAVIVAGYQYCSHFQYIDIYAFLPVWAYWLLGYLLAEFLQY